MYATVFRWQDLQHDTRLFFNIFVLVFQPVLLSQLDQLHLTAGRDRVPTRRGLPQPGATNQCVVLTDRAGVNPEPLGRIS